jgi:23S rRNA (adenine-N6)-dimethyltransferase
MAKKEVKTDLWVYELLQEADIYLTPQGCDIKEIDEALKTASKSKTGHAGYPEYCGVVKDFVLVIEDKASLDKHAYKDENGLLSQDVKFVKDYAVNGALYYALHLAANTSYNKVLAFGVSGNEKHHKITPLFVNERGDYQELPDVETFISFNEANINEYYLKEILQEETDVEKTTAEILKDAEKLHNDLRNYGNLTTEQKPLVVSGIMLALREIEEKTFSIESLIGDPIKTDGQKIYEAIESNLKRVNVTPDTKRDKLLSQFSVIRDTTKVFTCKKLLMTKKKLPVRFTGQHFTIDKVLIKDAIRQANISNQDTVLDIGAGKGFLTVHLLKIANNVVAIENDTALVEHLRKLFSDARNVQVVGCDFRNFAVPKFPFKVVSNIPYGITSDIFKILMFESLGNFLGGSIVLQLEPTQKLFSRKLYNPYTVFYHTFFDLKLVYEVGPESFLPPPTVKSALLNIKRKHLFFDFKFKAKYLAFISCLLEKPDLSVKTALKSIFRKSQVRSISEKFGLNLNAQIVCLSPSQWLNCFLEMLEVVPEKFHPS